MLLYSWGSVEFLIYCKYYVFHPADAFPRPLPVNGRGLGGGSDIPIFLFRVEARTRLGNAREVSVSDDLSLREHLVEGA